MKGSDRGLNFEVPVQEVRYLLNNEHRELLRGVTVVVHGFSSRNGMVWKRIMFSSGGVGDGKIKSVHRV